jgi:hypothetical protein
MGALPSIGSRSLVLIDDLEEKRREAEFEIKKGQDQLQRQKNREEDLRKQVF